jgi:hypothetical protein
MNTPLPQSVYTVSTGTTSTSPFIPVMETRNPLPSDTSFSSGKYWINTIDDTLFYLNGFDSSTGLVLANWQQLTSGSSSGSITVTGSSGIVVGGSPVAPGGTLTLTNMNIPNSALDPIANSTLVNSTIGLSAGTGVVIGGSPVALGSTATIGVDNIPNSALQPIQNAALVNSSISVVGGTGISVTGSPVSLGGSVTISATAAATNPSFHAYLSVDTTSTGIVPCDSTRNNVNSFYDTTTFTATIPVTGMYLFVGTVATSNTSNTTSIQLMNNTSGVSYQTNNCNSTAIRNGSGFFSMNANFLVPMTAGDQIQLLFNNNPSQTLSGLQGTVEFTSFSGSLIA